MKTLSYVFAFRRHYNLSQVGISLLYDTGLQDTLHGINLLRYHISFTQFSNQGLFSFCQNVRTASHTSTNTELSNFMKFAITISTKVTNTTSQPRSWFT